DHHGIERRLLVIGRKPRTVGKIAGEGKIPGVVMAVETGFERHHVMLNDGGMNHGRHFHRTGTTDIGAVLTLDTQMNLVLWLIGVVERRPKWRGRLISQAEPEA